MELRREFRPDLGAVVAHPQDGAVLGLFRTFGVLTSHQAAELAGLSGAAAKESVKRLFRLGYLDRLVTGRTPPLYAAGEGAARLFGIWRKDWDVVTAFRTVAANQLCAALMRTGKVENWEVGAKGRATARFTRAGREYWVLAPRCGPMEVAWAASVLSVFPPAFRVIVVCGDEGVASRVAPAARGEAVRFTWDALLKEGPVRLFRWGTGRLEEAELVGAA
ncbi:MAG: hypothetical protein ACPLRW_05795 [Moorellales bacterium]